MGDLVAATAQLLRDASVANGRVWSAELPEAEVEHMPRGAVVVRGSGSASAQGWMPMGRRRVDVRCYGPTPGLAALVGLDVETILQRWTAANVTYVGADGATRTVRVSWFRHVGGGNQLRDPDTDWPFLLTVWAVFGDAYV